MLVVVVVVVVVAAAAAAAAVVAVDYLAHGRRTAMEAPISRASNSRPKITTVSRILRARCFAFFLVLVAREQLAPENDNCLEDSACALTCNFACSCGRAPTLSKMHLLC